MNTLREIAKRDYLRLRETDARLRETQATLAVDREEVERLSQILTDLRDEVIHAAINSTDALMRERLLAAVDRAASEGKNT